MLITNAFCTPIMVRFKWLLPHDKLLNSKKLLITSLVVVRKHCLAWDL